MNEEVLSVLLGTAGLTVACVIALFITLLRPGISAEKTGLQATARVAVLAILIQATHFVEELATGFHKRFPDLLGLAPWPPRFFVSFNLIWLAIWSLSIWGLKARQRPALFPLWFLAIGCIANGLAHPLFAILTGGYFPGLVTSPFAGLVGVLLLRRLFLITNDRNPAVRCAREAP